MLKSGTVPNTDVLAVDPWHGHARLNAPTRDPIRTTRQSTRLRPRGHLYDDQPALTTSYKSPPTTLSRPHPNPLAPAQLQTLTYRRPPIPDLDCQQATGYVANKPSKPPPPPSPSEAPDHPEQYIPKGLKWSQAPIPTLKKQRPAWNPVPLPKATQQPFSLAPRALGFPNPPT